MSTDSDIIRRSLDLPSAFAELFERHARVVGTYAARRVGSQAAEDVLSETMLVAFRRRRDFDLAWDSAKPWLLGIASRVIKKHHAQEAKQWRSFEASVTRGEHVSDGAIEQAAARADASSAVRALAPRIAAGRHAGRRHPSPACRPGDPILCTDGANLHLGGEGDATSTASPAHARVPGRSVGGRP